MSIVPRYLLLLLALVPIAALPNAGEPAAGTIASQEFRDQYGKTDSLARQAGAPVVVVVVTVKGLAMIEKWERDLSERVAGVRFLNVADFPPGVPVDLDRAALTLRKRVPAGVVVLMDPARAWATAYALDTAVPNLLVFDGAGQLTARFRGRWTAALGGEVAAKVAAEVAKAVPPTRAPDPAT